jgi:hypothetical protein
VNAGETFCRLENQAPSLKSIRLVSLTCCHYLGLDLDRPTGRLMLVLKEV